MLKSVQQLQQEAKQEIPEVSVAQVQQDLAGGKPPYILIDVREPNEHAAGMIPGALPIPRGLLELQIAKVTQDPAQKIVCYCGGGTRSLFGAQQLKKVGFTNVLSMDGGFRAWVAAGGAVQQP